MRSKAPLVMMEQMIMLLVFALAAVLCLQAFTTSREISDASICRDRAVIEAQNTAEALKDGFEETYFTEKGGKRTEAGVEIFYDADWKPVAATDAAAEYKLQMEYKETANSYLHSAEIAVYDIQNELLFQLPVSWQSREAVQ